jgi:hypothetical protein
LVGLTEKGKENDILELTIKQRNHTSARTERTEETGDRAFGSDVRDGGVKRSKGMRAR